MCEHYFNTGCFTEVMVDGQTGLSGICAYSIGRKRACWVQRVKVRGALRLIRVMLMLEFSLVSCGSVNSGLKWQI